MGNRNRVILILIILALCIAADQATKHAAKSRLHGTKMVTLAGGTLKLDYSENKGAVFVFE